MDAGAVASFAGWAATAEAIGAIGWVSLCLGAGWFFGGTIFGRHDARTVQVGPALLSHALAAVAGVAVASLGERWVAHGDAGDLAADLLADRTDTGLALPDPGTVSYVNDGEEVGVPGPARIRRAATRPARLLNAATKSGLIRTAS